jgi:antitoxin component of MazEF toxin-antitoxin module
MPHQYQVKRKLQEQSGSYFVILPKIWVKALGLKESDALSVTFNDVVKITPIKS